jgi:alpha-glucosidase
VYLFVNFRYTTYAPKPVYITDYNRSMLLETSEIVFFNLSNTDKSTVTIYSWSTALSGQIMLGSTWLELIELITTVTGRQPGVLPSWSQRGAIVGLEGGAENVTKTVDELKVAGIPVAGVWLQDWVGLRHSWDGDRLIWNWEVNYDWYPGWNMMVRDWAADGTKVLTYISPFFSDPSNFTNSTSIRRNLYQEGITNEYFVKNSLGEPYVMKSLSIEFCMLDLTNPDAVMWMKNIIITEMLTEAQSSGWMCDFGEYLPFDAQLYSGQPASSYHNQYPQDWAAVNMAAIKEAHADDALFFVRSAWLKSPASVPVFWLGDQLVSWDGDDGLKSAITGALSAGLTGHAVTHSDIGGYNVVTSYGPSMYYVRSPELLKRWSEFAAFGSGNTPWYTCNL